MQPIQIYLEFYYYQDNFIHNFLTFETWPYFTFHETLTSLYDSNDMVRNTIDNMVQIDEKIPHSAQKLGWHNKQPSYVYKQPNIADMEV